MKHILQSIATGTMIVLGIILSHFGLIAGSRLQESFAVRR